MLALRLSLGAQPAVQVRRLLVAGASAGTGFLLLSALGHALSHPDPAASALRLAWCAGPLASTVYLALAVARTDPATRPRPGLSAVGLGPVKLMAISAATTAAACLLGSVLALLVFLQLRGDLTGMPLGGGAREFLAAGRPLPLPAALTLLALVPLSASAAVAMALRPRDPVTGAGRTARAYGRFGAYRRTPVRESFGAYGRFGRQFGAATRERRTATELPAPEQAGAEAPSADAAEETADGSPAVVPPPVPTAAPSGLPWGIAVLAVGLAVEALTSRTGSEGGPAAFLGLALTSLGLALVGPGLAHLCGRLLQAVRPGALRLLAGRVLMTEATRIGRPLGVVCAVVSAAYAMASLHDRDDPSAGPLVVLGVLLVAGCTVATLLTAAVEAKQAHADTTASLRRLGAPAGTLRRAAVLRAAALLALFGPLTVAVAELSAWPLGG
ncbi:hypothetical protein OIE82_09585 [Streptomyces althioticus]|uniref:Integral membrane protein n=1 Tax=Streptomyces althioticus TaxID=83380 RepID=A0ABZ1Y1Q5_9ACTN|nr:hypothetical protein OG968_09915 [Streptomyces althioticus]GGQ92135.1 hypothetical protein GCM10010267_63820 [Streptomyces griseorubens]